MKRSVAAARAIAAGLALLATAAAAAQTIYRCGPDGRTYAQKPCGEGRAVDAADHRSDEQRAAAEAVAQRERQLADAMERERLSREAAAQATPAAGLGPQLIKPQKASVPRKPKASTKKKKGARSQDAGRDFVAVDPAELGSGRRPARRGKR